MDRRTDTSMGAADDARFERLIDGELPAEEYRSLLAALDEEPGGWRRCALALLEQQALACELRSIYQLSPKRAPVSLQPPANRWSWLPTLLAVAASFLLAFGLGIAAPRYFFPRGQDRPLTGNLPMQPVVGVDQAKQADGGHYTLRPVGNLRLIMDGRAEGGQVPVYETAGEIGQYLADDDPVLGPQLLEVLRQRGYEVRHEQQYFPAATDDGRQIIVPVDGYQITPVSRKY